MCKEIQRQNKATQNRALAEMDKLGNKNARSLASPDEAEALHQTMKNGKLRA